MKRNNLARILALTAVLLLGVGMAWGQITINGSGSYPTLQSAISAATPGDLITIPAGTTSLASGLNVNKANLTIEGAGSTSTILQVSGGTTAISISASGVTLQNLQLEKTDKATQTIIQLVNGNNVTIKNNIIHGQFVIGDPEVSRAIVFNAGSFNGVNIEGNTFYALRQPAYISGTHTGTIQNNYIYGTKGWVLEGGNLTFTGNTWGTGANANVYDIAILSLMPALYYTDIVVMSNANNGAFIEDQRSSPAVLSIVYVDGSVVTTGDGTARSPKKTVAEGVSRVATGGTVHVLPGTYNEDVIINKRLTLLGAGIDVSTVSGLIGGGSATFQVGASGVIIDGFTITRDGNTLATWNGLLNSAGVAVQGLTSAEIRNSKFIGNRTAIDINNSNGNNIHNNIISDNRSGLLFRNQTDNTTVIQNEITNNWTVGVLFIDASGGTNSPVQSALNSNFNDNNISGNWYGQIVDRQTGGSLPLPGNNLKNFNCNWYGSISPVVSIQNSTEPGYAALIPVAYGGTAVPPGGKPDIAGPASANLSYIPFLTNGADNSLALGFQPTPGSCTGGLPVTITASVFGGHGTVSPASQTVIYGGTASITISPDPGYYISSITDNLSSATIANPYIISNATADHNVVVTFAINSNAMKQAAKNDVAAYLTDPDKKIRDAVSKATDRINQSLDPELWADMNHLTLKGKKVFDKEKEATNELQEKILKKFSSTSAVYIAAMSSINHMIQADKNLAEIAIAEVVCNGDVQCERELAKANEEMGKALADYADGKYDKAIDDYRNAWEHAMKAAKKALPKESASLPEVPTVFSLGQNYPNPFNPTTTISFGLPSASPVSLVVYNTLGQSVAELVNGNMEASYHEVRFNAGSLASGVYFYRMTAGKFTEMKKLMLLK